MKKLFLTMLMIGSCALVNAQEVASAIAKPSFDATVGYTEAITTRGLSYGGDGIVTGIHGKIPTKWADLHVGAYHLWGDENEKTQESQSHFSLFASKGWNWDKWAIKARAGVRKHQVSASTINIGPDIEVVNPPGSPAIHDSVAVEASLTLSEDPIGITNWVKPSVSVWRDTDYDYSGVTWGLHNTWHWDVVGHQWHITPAIQWGSAGKMKTTGDYDYTKATLRVGTEVNVFGQTWEPSVKLTYLDNDINHQRFVSESETSVWAGVKYRF